MWTPVVVELDPVGDDPAGVLQTFEPVPVRGLLLERPDHTLDHAVLLRTVRRDEFVSQAVAAHQTRVGPAGEHQVIVRTQKEGLRHSGQAAEARDQRLLQRRSSGRRLAATGELPTEQFPRVAVYHQRKHEPAVTARPHPA